MIINHGSGKQWTKVWRVEFTLQILGSGPIFDARLPWRYCACGQRDYYTSWWRNRQTDPNPIFLSFQQALSNWKPFLRTLLWSVSFQSLCNFYMNIKTSTNKVCHRLFLFARKVNEILEETQAKLFHCFTLLDYLLMSSVTNAWAALENKDLRNCDYSRLSCLTL